MKRHNTPLLLVVCAILLASAVFAQQPSVSNVPNLIRYEGTLKDAENAPLTSLTASVTFAIYRQQNGGAPVWLETQNVSTDAAGSYSLLLGSTTAAGLPDDLFSPQEQRWLSVQVQGQTEQPRVLLVSVPYALKAHEAETLGGRSVSDFVLANGANSPGAVANSGGTGSAPANNPMPVGGTKGVTNDGPTDFSGNSSSKIVGVTQSGSGPGLYSTAGKYAVEGAASSTLGVVGSASGVGVTESIGVEGEASTGPAGGAYAIGVLGVTTGSGNSHGIEGQARSTSGVGMRGIALGTTSNTFGVLGEVQSANATAVVAQNDCQPSCSPPGGGMLLAGIIGTGQQQHMMFSVDVGGNVSAMGNVNAAGMISVSNNSAYQFAGSSVLSIGMTGLSSANTWLGMNSGISDSNRQGASNTGTNNTYAGANTGMANMNGSHDTYLGYSAGVGNTSGNNNTFLGDSAGADNTIGGYNSFVGSQAGVNSNISNNLAATNDIFIGYDAGANNVSGSNDIYIGNAGPATSENNTIRIGGITGTEMMPQTATYILGIYGSTVDNQGIPVNVDNNGQLGTVVSSRRFKEQIDEMGDASSGLMKLRPVTFLYKPEFSKGERTLQFGLIAEEVAQVYPELVAYDKDGQPYTVRYQYLAPMLLNEVQKQSRRAEQQSEMVAAQQAQIMAQNQEIEKLKGQLQVQNAAMQERLSRLEGLIREQTQTLATAQKP